MTRANPLPILGAALDRAIGRFIVGAIGLLAQYFLYRITHAAWIRPGQK